MFRTAMDEDHGMLFDLGTREAAGRFLAAIKLFLCAESLRSWVFSSRVSHPARSLTIRRMGGWNPPSSTSRISSCG